MNQISALSILAVMCFVSAAYGTDCITGSGITIQLNCPGKMDASKVFCCKFGTSNSISYRCCDVDEYANQQVEPGYTGGFTVNKTITSPSFNQTFTYTRTTTGINGTGLGIIAGIIILAILSIAGCVSCCFWSRCPCYRACHSKSMLVQQPHPRHIQEEYIDQATSAGWVY